MGLTFYETKTQQIDTRKESINFLVALIGITIARANGNSSIMDKKSLMYRYSNME